MGKRLLSLYVDDESIAMAKAKGINISQLFRNMLKAEIKFQNEPESVTKDDVIMKLKAEKSYVIQELEIKSKEAEKLKKELEDLKKTKEADKKPEEEEIFIA